jgi:hypothetical protein
MRKGLILSAWLAIVPVWLQGSIDPSGVRLDHTPLAVRDLPAAIAQFSRLGFTIKPGRPHRNGIENASIKFADASYVELLTSHEASDEISREYQEFLRKQEGVAYVFVRDEAVTRVTSRVLQAGGHRAESGPFAFTAGRLEGAASSIDRVSRTRQRCAGHLRAFERRTPYRRDLDTR